MRFRPGRLGRGGEVPREPVLGRRKQVPGLPAELPGLRRRREVRGVSGRLGAGARPVPEGSRLAEVPALPGQVLLRQGRVLPVLGELPELSLGLRLRPLLPERGTGGGPLQADGRLAKRRAHFCSEGGQDKKLRDSLRRGLLQMSRQLLHLRKPMRLMSGHLLEVRELVAVHGVRRRLPDGKPAVRKELFRGDVSTGPAMLPVQRTVAGGGALGVHRGVRSARSGALPAESRSEVREQQAAHRAQFYYPNRQ